MNWLRVACVVVCMTTQSPAIASGKVPIPIPRPEQSETPSASTSISSASENKILFSGAKLSLEDAVFLGLRKNRTIRSAYIDRVSQKFGLQVSEDRFNPQFEVSGTVSRQRLSGSDATVVEVSPGFSLLTKSGATVDFAWNTTANWQDATNSFSSAAQIGIQQPLLRGAGVEVNMAPVQSARLGELVNKLRLQATISETVARVILAHRALLTAQLQLQLAQNSLDRSKDLLEMNNALISSGRMASMEAVQTEADIESQNLSVLQARQTLESSRLALLDLLALDLSTKIVAVESIAPKKAETKIAKLLPIALSERQDYLGQAYVVEQNRLGITVAKNEQLWDVSLYANANLGNQYNEGVGSEPIANVMAGLKFAIPIHDLGRQQQLVDANTGLQSADLQLEIIRSGIEMQIRESSSQIDLLWQQIAVAERSRELALQSVTIEKTKLNAGRSTTFQVRSFEANLRVSESQLLNARIGYLNALTQLDLQLGTTLATWHITFED